MPVVDFIVRGKDKALQNFYVNGKSVALNNGEQGTKVARVSLETNTAEVVIYRAHEYIGRLWWLWNLFCYLISVFGIFDTKKDKSCTVVDCRFNLNLTQEVTKVYITEKENGEEYASIDTLAEKEELSNLKYIDHEGFKRKKRLKGYKFLTFFTVLTLLVVILIFTL